jgi:hypothetical protein
VKAKGIGGEREDKFKENFIAMVHFAYNEEKCFSCWVVVGLAKKNCQLDSRLITQFITAGLMHCGL